ncbi:MAG: OsmC family protein [Gemmatimonadaceae bacterium]
MKDEADGTQSPATGPTPVHDKGAHPDTFRVTVTLEQGYQFRVDPGMDGAEGFLIDEPPPLGKGAGPNPARVLASAMASCLGASFLFCLRKAQVEVTSLKVIADGHMVRDAKKRLRVGGIDIRLEPVFADPVQGRVERCQSIFEDFCVVTESVRHGIPVAVAVTPSTPSPAGA